jgi:PAS domain S-box-containing protein
MNPTVPLHVLQESEELHRITIMSMSDAVFITDDDGLFTYICPNVDVIFGWRQDEVRAIARISGLLGRNLVDAKAFPESGELRNIEHEVETKAGDRRALLVHVKRVLIKGGTLLYVCRDITERKESEQVLRRNEERLRLALAAASAGSWDWHVPTGQMTWSPETHQLFGDPNGIRVPSFDAFLERVHVSDRERVAQTMNNAMEHGASYETEFSVVGYDGIERWVMAKGTALRNGKPLRMLGVFVDLSDRHHAQNEIQKLGGQLINAHEHERIRLARELHDDVGQRVALLSMELVTLREQLHTSAGQVRDRLTQLASDAVEIGTQLHRFAHELHPARLAQLGLEESIRSFCEDLNRSTRVKVELTIGGLPPLHTDIALCLYRIAQEALQNVVKHSGISRATLVLTGTGDELVLEVSDQGAGFETSAPRRQDTLGLVSMRERARLVHGQLTVSSQPGAGTTVCVRVPVASQPL